MENKGKKTYQLNASERQTLLDLNSAAAAHKVRVHDLNVQLEQANKERDACLALFNGALAMLANAHEMSGATVDAQFTTLTKE